MFDSKPEIKSKSKEFLLLAKSHTLDSAVIESLRRNIRALDWYYYVQSESVLSDYDYDQLFKFLQKLEKEFPDSFNANSPTQKVAYGIAQNIETIDHLTPMLSLGNSYDFHDLEDFHSKIESIIENEALTYFVEPKYDGAGISLIYENGNLVRAVTRGDGEKGEAITHNAQVIKNIPLRINAQGVHLLEVRGEVLVSKSNFKGINAKREEAGLSLFANPRNTASGSLRMLDSKEVASRQLEAVFYHVSLAEDSDGKSLLEKKLNTQELQMNFIYTAGLRSTKKEASLCKDIASVYAFCKEWELKRPSYDFEIDGMVLKVNQRSLQFKLGFTAHHPRWAMAYKFKAQQVKTILENIEFQVGRTGIVTPVAKLQSVQVAGVNVGSVSLFNEEFVKEKDLRIGDVVCVERAGDVIPYIAEVDLSARKSPLKPFVFIKKCPVCKSDLFKNKGEVAWRCGNVGCAAKIVERIKHFVSKKAMDIDGLGGSNIERFFELGFIKSLEDLYRLDYQALAKLDGFGEKSISNLKAALENSKLRPPDRLLFALGIPFVGERTSKLLVREVDKIEDLASLSKEALMSLNDVGPKVAESVADYFTMPSNVDLLKSFRAFGLPLDCLSIESSGGQWEGKTFLFTGTLNKLNRNRAKELVEKHGGTVLSGVSKKLDYLVVGEKAGSKLKKAKAIFTIKILNEDAFIEMLEGI